MPLYRSGIASFSAHPPHPRTHFPYINGVALATSAPPDGYGGLDGQGDKLNPHNVAGFIVTVLRYAKKLVPFHGKRDRGDSDDEDEDDDEEGERALKVWPIERNEPRVWVKKGHAGWRTEVVHQPGHLEPRAYDSYNSQPPPTYPGSGKPLLPQEGGLKLTRPITPTASLGYEAETTALPARLALAPGSRFDGSVRSRFDGSVHSRFDGSAHSRMDNPLASRLASPAPSHIPLASPIPSRFGTPLPSQYEYESPPPSLGAYSVHSGMGGSAHSRTGGSAHSRMEGSVRSRMDASAHSRMDASAHSRMDGSAQSRMYGSEQSRMGGSAQSRMGGSVHSRVGTPLASSRLGTPALSVSSSSRARAGL